MDRLDYQYVYKSNYNIILSYPVNIMFLTINTVHKGAIKVIIW